MTLAEDIAYLSRLAEQVANGEALHGYQTNNAYTIRKRLIQANGPQEYIDLAAALEQNKLPNY